jgi:hypothetical protein
MLNATWFEAYKCIKAIMHNQEQYKGRGRNDSQNVRYSESTIKK